jgi:hypothetical protein
MKILIALTSVVGLSVAPVFAGEGQISNRSLTRMGLPEMKTLSDTEGLSIRGTSFAIAGSYAFVSGGTTIPIVNHPVGQHFAISVTIAIGGGAFAGGGSFATAH